MSRDASGLGVLFMYYRYCYQNTVEEYFLFCKSLDSHITGEEMSKHVGCIDVCVDGARRRRGTAAGVSTLWYHLVWAVAARFSKELLLKRCAQVWIFFSRKTHKNSKPQSIHAFSARLFKILCEEMGCGHTTPTLHTEIRWLSKGKNGLSEIVIFKMFLLLCRAPTSSVTLCNTFLMIAEIGIHGRQFHRD
jgi:hypothetical protein